MVMAILDRCRQSDFLNTGTSPISNPLPRLPRALVERMEGVQMIGPLNSRPDDLHEFVDGSAYA